MSTRRATIGKPHPTSRPDQANMPSPRLDSQCLPIPSPTTAIDIRSRVQPLSPWALGAYQQPSVAGTYTARRQVKPVKPTWSERLNTLCASPWVTLCFGTRKECEEVLRAEKRNTKALPIRGKRRGGRKEKAWCSNLRMYPMGSVVKFINHLTKFVFVLAALVLIVHAAILYPSMLLIENAAKQCK